MNCLMNGLDSLTESVPALCEFDSRQFCCEFDLLKDICDYKYEPFFNNIEDIPADSNKSTNNDTSSKGVPGKVFFIKSKSQIDMLNTCPTALLKLKHCHKELESIIKDRNKKMIRIKKAFLNKNTIDGYFISKGNNLVCIQTDGWIFPVLAAPLNLDSSIDSFLTILWNFTVYKTFPVINGFIIDIKHQITLNTKVLYSKSAKIVEIPKEKFVIRVSHTNLLKITDETTETVTSNIIEVEEGNKMKYLMYFIYMCLTAAPILTMLSGIQLMNRKMIVKPFDVFTMVLIGLGSISLFISIFVFKSSPL